MYSTNHLELAAILIERAPVVIEWPSLCSSTEPPGLLDVWAAFDRRHADWSAELQVHEAAVLSHPERAESWLEELCLTEPLSRVWTALIVARQRLEDAAATREEVESAVRSLAREGQGVGGSRVPDVVALLARRWRTPVGPMPDPAVWQEAFAGLLDVPFPDAESVGAFFGGEVVEARLHAVQWARFEDVHGRCSSASGAALPAGSTTVAAVAV